MKLTRLLAVLLVILSLVFTHFSGVFAEVQLDDGNGYFKFTEVDKKQVMKYGGPKLIEGKDRILCFEYFGYEENPHREVRFAGFWDENYQQIYKPNWKRIAGFYNGIAKVEDESGKAIFIDTKGNVVLETNYDYVQCGNYQDGLISVVLEPYNEELYWGKCGYIDITGEVVLRVPERFNICGDFINGYAVVGAVVYTRDFPELDPNGEVIIYTRGAIFRGFIDKEGNFVGEPSHLDIRDYAEDMSSDDRSIGYNMENGFVISEYLADEETGDRISDANYYHLKRLSRNLFFFKRDINDNGGLITKDGRIVLESQYPIVTEAAVPDFPKMPKDSTMAQLAFVHANNESGVGSKLICYDAEGNKLFENDFLIHNAGYTTNNFMLVETYEYTNIKGTQMISLYLENSKVYIVEVNQ
ncbi:WG repeat-containing protein [Tissierella sp. Yu-01]|uniref:WG repeat-containing protein n=1 Tax=Tissierella sp. Yu-01 TaxID=3035694 RepID=UPI00240DADE4|nr:WG repeat-containing protein [Tissierella sp. Yu-01]WFA08540.1 WG repeat-containing protein [Tissierella sp. Yu-01]